MELAKIMMCLGVKVVIMARFIPFLIFNAINHKYQKNSPQWKAG